MARAFHASAHRAANVSPSSRVMVAHVRPASSCTLNPSNDVRLVSGNALFGGSPIRQPCPIHRSRNDDDAATSAMATLSATTVGHPHDGFVPCTTTVRRTGAKPGAVTSRLYVPAVPGTRQIVLQGML